MEDWKRIKAEIISGSSENIKALLRQISKELEELSADELGTLSIIMGLYRLIKEEEKNNIIMFPGNKIIP